MILLEDDFCIKIKSTSTPNGIEPFKFRYWLNAKYVQKEVGKVKKVSLVKNVKFNQFINLSEVVNLEETNAAYKQM